MNRKARAASLSIGSNTALIGMKFAVGVVSGSVSIISEALHSMMDLVAAIIAFFSVRVADRPPDADHPYGHEKAENVSGVVEAMLILAASAWIVYEAVKKLLHPAPMDAIGLGFAVMLVSAVVNTFVARHLYRVAREEDSVAIEADALHLKADVYTSLGVAGGLGILWLTGLHFLDPVVAILVALFILREAWGMLRSAYRPLVDAALSAEEQDAVRAALERHRTSFVDFHEVRTRRSGKVRHVDFHLTVSKGMTVAKSHALCDRIERDIAGRLKNTKVLIHIEPGHGPCDGPANLTERRICGRAHEIARQVAHVDVAPHDMLLARHGDEPVLAFHIMLPAEMALAEAHALATKIERRIQRELDLKSVIHMEPAGPGKRPAPARAASGGRYTHE